MSLTTTLDQLRRFPALLLPPRAGSDHKACRVLVLEPAGAKGCKAVEARIEPDSIHILSATYLEHGLPAPAGVALAPSEDVAVTLLPDSRKSVCRMLDMAKAPLDQIQQMVALRLEIELPYPVAESTWVCEPRSNGAASTERVLLIAMPTSAISDAEKALAPYGVRRNQIEYVPAALAELGLAQSASRESVAVVHVDGAETILVLTHNNSLCYARHIRRDTDDPSWPQKLAKEVKQSLYDFTLRTKHPMPREILTVGTSPDLNALQPALEAQSEMPVVRALLSGSIHVSNDSLTEEILLSRYSSCIGVLMATRRRMAGELAAAPIIRTEKKGLRSLKWHGRGKALIQLNAGLVAALLLVMWLGNWFEQRGTDKLMHESRPLLHRLEGLQEEVDILRYETKSQRSVVDALLLLSEKLPSEMKIESITLDSKGKMAISGTSSTVEVASDTAIAALEKSSAFIKPTFNGARREKDGYTFQITCDYRGGH